MGVITRGDRELGLRFDVFPDQARKKLEERIRGLTEQLDERVAAAAPVRTGKLRTEIASRTFSGQQRVAGYVSVYAPGVPTEYPKAATLEYGSNKVRRVRERLSFLGRLGGVKARLVKRAAGKPAHIAAFRYLRGPFEGMRAEIEAALDEAIAETVAEGDEKV
jgi:hypothetical protein